MMSYAARRRTAGHRSTWQPLVIGLVLALALLAHAAGARAAVYWGGVLHGEVYGEATSAPLNQAAWSNFERHAGKEVSLVSMGQRWDDFETVRFQAARDGGAIPLVVMTLPDDATLTEVVNGAHDAVIKAWAKKAKAWSYPFLFAPWWEMNGTWFHWGRHPDYVAAWRRFHDLVVAEGATNVTWTWLPNSIWDDPASDPAPYYPGDAYVDWVGFDVYNWGLSPLQSHRWLSPAQTLSPILRRLKEIAPSKPIVVGENATTEFGGNKANWIQELLATYLPHHREIKAYAWFNWNVAQYGGRFDWPIESSIPAQQAFRNGIQSGFYLEKPPALPPLTKVPAPPAPSGGPDAQPQDLSTAGGNAGHAQVAARGGGPATVVWERFDGSNSVIQGRQIAVDGTLAGGTSTLSTPGANAFVPQVAAGPDGTATAVWIRFDGSVFVVEARRIAPDGSVGSSVYSVSASGRNSSEPQVAIGPDGVATIVWTRFNGTNFVVEARRLSPAGTLGNGSLTLSASGQNASEPQVAVGPSGTAVVAWTRFDGANELVEARRIAPTGTPEPTTHVLSEAGQDAGQPQLSIGLGGATTVVWNRFNGSHTVVQARRIAADGALDATTYDLSGTGQNAAEPQVTAAPDGSFIAAWTRFDGSNMVVQDRRIASGGKPDSPTYTLSTPGRDAAEPHIGMASNGAGSVVWSRSNGNNFIVQERRIAANGAPLAPSRDLSAAGDRASGPHVVTRSEGETTAIWRRFNGANDVIQGTIVEPVDPPKQGFDGGGAADASAPRSSGKANSSAFLKVGRPLLNKRMGTAVLPVSVSGAGTLSLTGKDVVSLPKGPAKPSATLEVQRATTVGLPVRARGAKLRQLKKRGRTKVGLTISFLPVGSGPETFTRSLVLKRRRP